MKQGRCNKKGSRGVFGICPKTCYGYMRNIELVLNRKLNILVPDSMDGYTAITFLRYGHNVDCYEKDNVLLNGGIIDSFHTIGFNQKILNEKLQDLVKINDSNYYELKVEKQYDFVYSYRSLHLERNKHLSLKKKVKKLLSSVKTNGYLYIFYYMADNNSDYINYPENQYFRPYEMKSYFDLNDWEIIYSIENHVRIHTAHPFNKVNHFHKVGTIFARKKNNRRKLIYRYIYTIK